MTSWFTMPMHGTNPLATTWGAVAKQSSKVGSCRFVFLPQNDDRQNFRFNKGLTDNPFRDHWGWVKWRWNFHDFRMFGLFGALRKHYYIGEAWRRKDEKIFMGKDPSGNKYWMGRRSGSSNYGKIIEPADPHWFRGQDPGGTTAPWHKWLTSQSAHTPAAVRARGELGRNSHSTNNGPFNYKHTRFDHLLRFHNTWRDPGYCFDAQLLNPDYKVLEEAGFSRWFQMQAQVSGPVHPPFFGEHAFSDDLVEEYYRGQWAFCRSNKGTDHDNWSG